MTIEEAIEKANEVTGGEVRLERRHGLWIASSHDYQRGAGTTLLAAIEALIAERIYRAAEAAERAKAAEAPLNGAL